MGYVIWGGGRDCATRKTKRNNSTSVGAIGNLGSDYLEGPRPGPVKVISVLLVDHHALVRDGLRALLQAERDIKVVGEAADGEEALRQVCEIRPDIVIMDMDMPDLNSVDVTARIRDACSSCQVIILSAYAVNEHATRAFKAGAIGYLL